MARTSPAGCLVRAARTDTAIDLAAAPRVSGLQIVVTSQSGAAAGSALHAGKPLASGAVVVFAADASRWAYPSRFVKIVPPIQPDGSFHVQGLPAGRYLAAAVESMASDWHAPESLERLRAGATAFDLAAGGGRTVVTVIFR